MHVGDPLRTIEWIPDYRYDLLMRSKRFGLGLGVGFGFVLIAALAANSAISGYSAAVNVHARGQFALLFAAGFGLASLMWFL